MENPDLALGVEFFLKPVENPRKSAEAGRAIYDEREYIRIALPGDSKSEIVAPANELHYVPHLKSRVTFAERFAAAYDAFKRDQADYVHGTPLSAISFVNLAEREELASQKVKTVEQLAGLTDQAIRKLGMGWREKVERAKAFLDRSKETAEVDGLKARIAELEAMMRPAPVAEAGSPFDAYERDDLFNMATDAGLEPRANASKESLVKMLTAKAAEAA